uniref:Uncharacterized protein n=1 Tax=Anguilla anguilla TaxID=7936 RepID=A0A0E9U087_ANGAN
MEGIAMDFTVFCLHSIITDISGWVLV